MEIGRCVTILLRSTSVDLYTKISRETFKKLLNIDIIKIVYGHCISFGVIVQQVNAL